MTPSRRKHPVLPRFMLLLVLALGLLATPLRTTAGAAPCDDRYEIKGDPDMPESPDPVQPGRTGGTRRSTFIEVRGPRTPPPTYTLLKFLARWPVSTIR